MLAYYAIVNEPTQYSIALYPAEEEPVLFYRKRHPYSNHIQTWVQGDFSFTRDFRNAQTMYWNQNGTAKNLPINPHFKNYRGTVVIIREVFDE